MDAEKRTAEAIKLVRTYFNPAVLVWKAPDVLVYMIAEDISPEAVENKIAELLEYMEKTKPEEETA